MPAFKTINKPIKNAGLSITKTELYCIKPNLKDLFLYCGKHNPKLYLNPIVRQGISSFSSLANRIEVDKGLGKLKLDIKNNTIEGVIDSYKNDLGDYLFIVVEQQ
jgi:hypothetical protein